MKSKVMSVRESEGMDLDMMGGASPAYRLWIAKLECGHEEDKRRPVEVGVALECFRCSNAARRAARRAGV
jgi:hypothetical protein